MNNQRSFKLAAFLALGLMVFGCPCWAKDPEAAARQAQIDAAEAKVKIEEIEQRERAATEVDGLSAPELRAEDAEIDSEAALKAEAEKRLEEAQKKKMK